MELPIKVKLNTPIKHGSAELVELVFNRRVTAGDMRGIPIRKEINWDEMMLLAARVAALPPSVLNQLEFEDAGEVARVVMSFLMTGQETGSTPAA